jgi:hypothetical protein
MCPRATKLRAAALAVASGLGLSACSDIYYDRRETVVPSAGDAMAVNRITQMTDPWPRESGNRNIAFNGEKMQTAVERYRQGRVIPPVNATTSSVAYAQAAQQAGSAQAAQSAPAPGMSAQASAPAGFKP